MSAIGLVVPVGIGMAVLFALMIMRRRRPSARLARLSKHRVPVPAAARGPRLANRFPDTLVARPVAATLACTTLAAGVALPLGGPVAGIVVALYAMAAVRGWRSYVVRRRADQALSDLLDAIDAAAGDLRAGLLPQPGALLGRQPAAEPVPAQAAIGRAAPVLRAPGGRHEPSDSRRARQSGDAKRSSGSRRADTVALRTSSRAGTAQRRAARREDAAVQVAIARLDAAQRISDALGTPLADLLDRVDADARAGRQARASVAAQTAGAQTTTVLLLGLPVVGLWIGTGLGVDPVDQLLYTRLGGGFAIAAAALQCAGLWWTGRIVRGAVRAVQ